VFRPGAGSLRHAFAYLPDLAETAAQLLDREDSLETFACFHFTGHFLSVDELVAGVRRASGRRLMALPFPWSLMGVIGLGNETVRELMEMRYLWRKPIGLSNSRLVAFLGAEPHTPLDTALREALDEPAAKAGVRASPRKAADRTVAIA
jgi:nucleoside-diphosphate-sugar epimerase